MPNWFVSCCSPIHSWRAELYTGSACIKLFRKLEAQMHAEMKDTPDAPKSAKKELEKLGPLSLDEKITSGAFAVTVGLWIFGASIGINAVAAALLGLTILLVTNVVKWKDCLGKVWDITCKGHLGTSARLRAYCLSTWKE